MAVVEQIYIDGQLFEQSEDGGIELVFQSSLFTDLNAIVSNRTNEVTFPLTAHNRRAMKLAGLVSPESSDLYEYRKHTATYWRDGVHIFDGSATLLSWTATEVSFVLTWGNSDAFQALFDTPLSELQNDENIALRYVPYGMPSVSMAIRSLYPQNLSFGLGLPFHTTTPPQAIHPTLPVTTIIGGIENYLGISGLSGEFSGLAVPLTTKKTDREVNILQAPHITEGSVSSVQTIPYVGVLGLTNNDTDYAGMVMDNRIFDVSGVNTISVSGTIVYFAKTPTTTDTNRFFGGVRIMASSEDGNNRVEIATITTYANSSQDDDGWYRQTFRAEDFNEEIDVADYSYIIFVLLTQAESDELLIEDAQVGITSVDMRVVPDIDSVQDVVYIGNENINNYPLYTNLPEMSIGEFLKNLMKIKGIFASVASSTQLAFVSVGNMYEGRPQAYNWTNRLLGSVQGISPTFEDYAQKNQLKYAEDDTVKGNYDGVLVVDNTTLAAEKELLTVDFAGTDGEIPSGTNTPIYTIEVYSEGNEGIEYNENITPRILEYVPSGSMFSRVGFNIGFGELVGTVYADYQRTILHPRVLTVELQMSAQDLSVLDLTKPCYFEQLGHYYAIINLSTKEGNRATATLLQLADK